MEDTELKKAILSMLNAELDAMHYYQKASQRMEDKNAIYHFNLLAQEELEHARTFYAVYPGDDLPSFKELVEKAGEREFSEDLVDPRLLGRLNERTALQVGMKIEQEVVESLKKMLQEINSPAARAVIEKNIESTLSHYELVKEDYFRLFDQAADS